MARLNVQAVARWQDPSGAGSFQNAPMLLAVSVTDADGGRVDLKPEELRVGYQHRVEPFEDSIAVISDFHPDGPSQGQTRWFSCLVHPQPTDAWGADEIVLLVTVRRPGASGSGTDNGQALTLARYRHPVQNLDLNASLSPITAAQEQTRRDIAKVASSLDNLTDLVAHSIALQPSGATASNVLGNILAIVEEIRKEV